MVDFICIGPGRSGSTWLFEVLRKHPSIFLAKNIKETEYFNTYFYKGDSFYKNFFSDSKPSDIKGEISNLYFFRKKTLSRIKDYNSSVKIIVLIREPYEKIKSLYLFKKREGLYKHSINEFINSKLFKENLREIEFDSILSDLLDLFSKDQIFILPFEKINSDQEELLKRLGMFLGLTNLENYKILKKINQSIVPRIFFLGALAKITAKILRFLKLYSILTSLKRSEFVKSIFFKKQISKNLKISENHSLDLKIKKIKNDYKNLLNNYNFDKFHFSKWL
jgi:hypothetical protein